MILRCFIILCFALNLSFAEDDGIVEINTKLNQENNGLEINVDELLNEPPVTKPALPETKTPPAINLPPVLPETQVKPVVNLPPVSPPKVESTAKPPVIELPSQPAKPNIPVKNTAPDDEIKIILPDIPDVQEQNKAPEIKPIKPEIIEPLLPKPSVTAPSLNVQPKPVELLPKDDNVSPKAPNNSVKEDNIDDIVMPDPAKLVEPKQPTTIAVPGDTQVIKKPEAKSGDLEFEGVIKQTGKGEPKQEKNKMLSIKPKNYTVEMSPNEIWKHSYMFSDDEIVKLSTALADFYNTSVQSDSKKTKVANVTRKSSFKISLNSIMYISENDWSVWINNKKYNNKESQDPLSLFKIISVNPKNVKIKLKIDESVKVPTSMDLNAPEKPMDKKVNYDPGTDHVIFDLYTNQVFDSSTMTINDN